MICIVALVVSSVLGIFSASHRRFAKEAFQCVSRRMTLRPCQMDFDRKIKVKIVSKLSGKSVKLASFTNKHFETISWVLTISMFASLAYSAYSIYNLIVFGTCDPISGVCLLTGTGI